MGFFESKNLILISEKNKNKFNLLITFIIDKILEIVM